MKNAASRDGAQRIRGIFGREAPPPIAVPLRDDAYEIAIDHIQPDPNQPRKEFDAEELRNLSDSIRENGILQPITVYQSDDPELYFIITGERRFRAAGLAGLTSVPCIVRGHDYDRTNIDQQQLVENIQRADLAPIEAARALRDLMKSHSYSQAETAKRLGKPRSFIVELMSILKIPEDLLNRKGAESLPKQTLVEVSRAPEGERHRLFEVALSGSPMRDVKARRSNRGASPRTVYYHERFPLENAPAIEIRWARDPAEVDSGLLADALGQVMRHLVTRTSKR
jgi:ParB family chromosome partitioning protein